MKVCIAEKPSVGREIAQIIGARTRHDGYFEGNGYCVTWTFGHFCTLKEPDDYQAEWKKWDFNTLPILPEKFDIKLIKNAGAKKQFGIIKTLLKKADEVINCGDAGQEGELIQRWVLKQAKYKGPIQRLWISSLTPEAIRDGFQNLKPASDYDNLYYAGSSRAIGDWILGMNGTRLFTLKYGGFKQVLSIGRVQTPTLAMLVARYLEIENFVPKPFWELSTIYRGTLFSCEQGRFEKMEDGDELLQQVTGKPFTVISCEKKKGKEYPPRLFDLTSLQVHCNKRFAYTAERTLKIVQKLYEQKVVTYPRVDTSYLPNDVYPKIPGTLQRMTSYSQFTQALLGKTLRKSKKVFDDKKVTDHHAIIPTGYEKSLITEEQNVYDAIARRFIAAFYPDCIVSNTKVIGEVDGIRFKATGKEILEEGWRVLFPPRKKSKDDDGDSDTKKGDEEKVLPSFVKGETGEHKPKLVEKMTQPPKHYTEATLLRGMETAGKKVDDEELRELMKSNGIGRPSTRANIIETLFRRRYVERKRKNLIATDMGVQLIGKIQTPLLKSAELTGQWEKQLREIELGEHSAGQFIKDMRKMVTDLVYEVRMSNDNRKIVAAQSTANRGRAKGQKSAAPRKSTKAKAGKADLTTLTCLKCRKGKLMKGKTAYGCSEWNSGCNFRLPFKFKEKKLPETQLARLMKQGSTVKLKGFKQNGAKVDGKARFNEAFELILEAGSAPASSVKKTASKASMICPKCKKGKIMKGKTAYGCSDWKSGCDFRFTFDAIREAAAGEKLTADLVTKILKT